ncbi:unnamed protein product [Spirodela intermedia]|uniref:Uncharacterized protein n=2 Tax=Spirodela intermedia TaxID=51605 RepID=A0A7I8JIS4_SPIIN|nr:unnamed protein product [Spirodela intermedia]CAA6670057.1 unnamed protein product [Spirodela intermedia]CAA7407092.1 unnamed protein product [Spirodela intermedia]
MVFEQRSASTRLKPLYLSASPATSSANSRGLFSHCNQKQSPSALGVGEGIRLQDIGQES